MSFLQFKKTNCKNCYKCVRYCPVKSISVKDHQAQIIEDECILCGNCTVICPQKAKQDISAIPQVKELLELGVGAVASVAPSFAAYFGLDSLEPLRQALMAAGFDDAFETAEGAYLVKSEYERLLAKAPGQTLISSCCASINAYIRKHKQEAIPYLAPVLTPMQAHARLLKERCPDKAVVFFGPCVSKKAEAAEDGSQVSCAVTFEELAEWLEEGGIAIQGSVIQSGGSGAAGTGAGSGRAAAEDGAAENGAAGKIPSDVSPDSAGPKRLSRMFPIHGGILQTMARQPGYRYVSVDGLRNSMAAIDDVINGRLPGCFIEMSACNGSCVGGPSFQRRELSALAGEIQVESIALAPYEEDFNIETALPLAASFSDQGKYYMKPSEKQIAGILKKMGKNTPADELNCGMCGYPSCRDKAVAVYYGKAEISMCLPFMKERAESFSDKIINITPNAIVAVDMDLKIQQVNTAACEIFGLTPQDLVGQPVSRILDEFDFVNMITQSTPQVTKYTFLAEYNVYLEQVFLYDKANSVVICIMKNITKEKQRKSQLMKAKTQAANMADDIVERQQRIAHEIASLLGETVAETKVAISDLKETILMDQEER